MCPKSVYGCWKRPVQTLISNKHTKKIKILAIYTPQEHENTNNELKMMYEDIREQIKIGKEKKQ